MEKAHYSTWYHCETCTGVIYPIACARRACAICRETLLHVPHPCPHCDGEASYLQFSPEDHEKFLRAMDKDPANLSFLAELGMDMNDPKILERGLNAVGPGSCYWKLSVALDRQLVVVRPSDSKYAEVFKHRVTFAMTTAVEIITSQLSAIEHIKMKMTPLISQREDLTNQIDALIQKMEKHTAILRQAESSYAVTLVLAKEQC